MKSSNLSPYMDIITTSSICCVSSNSTTSIISTENTTKIWHETRKFPRIYCHPTFKKNPFYLSNNNADKHPVVLINLQSDLENNVDKITLYYIKEMADTLIIPVKRNTVATRCTQAIVTTTLTNNTTHFLLQKLTNKVKTIEIFFTEALVIPTPMRHSKTPNYLRQLQSSQTAQIHIEQRLPVRNGIINHHRLFKQTPPHLINKSKRAITLNSKLINDW